MALTFTDLTRGSDVANTNIYTSASITLQAGKLGLLAVASHRTSGAASPSSISGPGTTTWVEVAHVDFNTIATPLRRLTLYRACNATDQTGTITINFANSQSNCFWQVQQVDGTAATSGNNGSDGIQQNATNRNNSATASPFTVTLAAFNNANNGTYGVFHSYAQTQNYTAGSGFSGGTNASGTGTASDSGVIFAEWKTSNDTTVDVTYTTAQGNAGIAIEIIASAGGVSVTPAAAAMKALAVAPTVVLGSLSLTPSSAAMKAQAVTPTVVLGSLSLTPAVAAMRALAIAPTVDTSVRVTPAAAAMKTLAVAPTVVQSSMTVSPAVAAMKAKAVAPTVVHGSLTLAPTRASMRTLAVAPSVIHGSITVAPNRAAMRTLAADPTVLAGGGGGPVSVTPSPASMRARAADPSVAHGSLVLAPARAAKRTLAFEPNVLDQNYLELYYDGQDIGAQWRLGISHVGLTLRIYLPPVGDGTGNTVVAGTEIEVRAAGLGKIVLLTPHGRRLAVIHQGTAVVTYALADAAAYDWSIKLRYTLGTWVSSA